MSRARGRIIVVVDVVVRYPRSNGRVDIVDGIKTIVSYDRKMKGGMKVRETRVWKHGPRGWKCVGVTRV